MVELVPGAKKDRGHDKLLLCFSRPKCAPKMLQIDIDGDVSFCSSLLLLLLAVC